MSSDVFLHFFVHHHVIPAMIGPPINVLRVQAKFVSSGDIVFSLCSYYKRMKRRSKLLLTGAVLAAFIWWSTSKEEDERKSGGV